MRSQFDIPPLKKRTSRPFLWFSVHIKADLHGRTGGADCLPQNRIMNSRTSVSPLSIQPLQNLTRSAKYCLFFNLLVGVSNSSVFIPSFRFIWCGVVCETWLYSLLITLSRVV